MFIANMHATLITSPLQWQRGMTIRILWFEYIFISESLLINSIVSDITLLYVSTIAVQIKKLHGWLEIIMIVCIYSTKLLYIVVLSQGVDT